MADHEVAAPAGRIAQHDDFIAQEFDTGRRAGDPREQRPVVADGRLRRAVNLTQGKGDTQRRGAARQCHRMIGVLGRRRGAAPAGLLDAFLGQERALDLDEMHVGRPGDAGTPHCQSHRRRRLLDLRRPADFLRLEGPRQADPDGKPRRRGR